MVEDGGKSFSCLHALNYEAFRKGGRGGDQDKQWRWNSLPNPPHSHKLCWRLCRTNCSYLSQKWWMSNLWHHSWWVGQHRGFSVAWSGGHTWCTWHHRWWWSHNIYSCMSRCQNQANCAPILVESPLHQHLPLHQGIIKHLFAWVIGVFGAAKIDARCHCLPPNHNIKLFMKGISSLSCVTGQQHSQMCCFLLGLILDIRLLNGASPSHLLQAIHALLDFLYLAQYPCHSTETLQLLDNTLLKFHENKDMFIDIGIHEHFKIPKLHLLHHYVMYIKLFRSPDNYNTQYTECLHIDLAKDAYHATNHRVEYPQMTLWLEQREKVYRHDQYVTWQLASSPPPWQWHPDGWDVEHHRHLKMTRHPLSMTMGQLISKMHWHVLLWCTPTQMFSHTRSRISQMMSSWHITSSLPTTR